MTSWQVTIALDTPSLANRREPWQARHRRVKLQRSTVFYALRAALGVCPFFLPVEVTLVRLAPHLLDDDNSIISLKTVRDACADYIINDYGHGVDNTPAIRWQYGQAKYREACVEVTFTPF